MARAIGRSLLIGLATMAVAGILYTVAQRFFCPQRQAWRHAHSGETVLTLWHQYRVPRAQDALFACEAPHRLGPVVLHTDLYCICAPASTPLALLSAAVAADAVCALKSPTGKDPVLARACAPAYCDAHVDLDASGRRLDDAQPR